MSANLFEKMIAKFLRGGNLRACTVRSVAQFGEFCTKTKRNQGLTLSKSSEDLLKVTFLLISL